jgi:hypothetical protein
VKAWEVRDAIRTHLDHGNAVRLQLKRHVARVRHRGFQAMDLVRFRERIQAQDQRTRRM